MKHAEASPHAGRDALAQSPSAGAEQELTRELIAARSHGLAPESALAVHLSALRLTDPSPLVLFCARLQIVDLRSNMIAELPPALFSLSGLRKLDVSYNALRSVPPPEAWARLPRLQVLHLNDNPIRSLRRATSLGALPELLRLSLFNCPVAAVPDYRHALTNLCLGLCVLDGHAVADEELVEGARAGSIFGTLGARALVADEAWRLSAGLAASTDGQMEQLEREVRYCRRLRSRASAVAQLQRVARGLLVRAARRRRRAALPSAAVWVDAVLSVQRIVRGRQGRAAAQRCAAEAQGAARPASAAPAAAEAERAAAEAPQRPEAAPADAPPSPRGAPAPAAASAPPSPPRAPAPAPVALGGATADAWVALGADSDSGGDGSDGELGSGGSGAAGAGAGARGEFGWAFFRVGRLALGATLAPRIGTAGLTARRGAAGGVGGGSERGAEGGISEAAQARLMAAQASALGLRGFPPYLALGTEASTAEAKRAVAARMRADSALAEARVEEARGADEAAAQARAARAPQTAAHSDERRLLARARQRAAALALEAPATSYAEQAAARGAAWEAHVRRVVAIRREAGARSALGAALGEAAEDARRIELARNGSAQQARDTAATRAALAAEGARALALARARARRVHAARAEARFESSFVSSHNVLARQLRARDCATAAQGRQAESDAVTERKRQEYAVARYRRHANAVEASGARMRAVAEGRRLSRARLEAHGAEVEHGTAMLRFRAQQARAVRRDGLRALLDVHSGAVPALAAATAELQLLQPFEPGRRSE